MNAIMNRALGIVAIGLLLGVAACSDSTPPDESRETNAVIENTPVEAPPPPEPIANAASAATEPANATVAPPPEEPLAADAQMLEDADATGMTAQLRPDESDQANGDGTPAESREAQ